MSLTLIEGHFRIIGAAPDGDSVKFYPNNGKTDWKLVHGSKPVKSNLEGGAQLRLDGIDSLETHYAPTGGELGTLHQPKDLADGAAQGLLDFLGFRDVERDSAEKVISAQPEQIPGYILTRFADKYGRCVAFAFKGNRKGKTGASVRFEVDELRQSLNYHMLETGLAYPTYYSKLFPDLRNAMTKAVNAARAEKRGVWEKDKTMSGLKVDLVLEKLEDKAYILPKLYRRLVDFIAFNSGDTSLEGFSEWLNEHDDRVTILPEGHFTGFDQAVEVKGQTVKLNTAIENLIFEEK
jgi:endonuclease YncB( thermonuclease family)